MRHAQKRVVLEGDLCLGSPFHVPINGNPDPYKQSGTPQRPLLLLSPSSLATRRCNQLPDREVVDDLLRLLDGVLDAVDALSQRVVLKVQ